MTFFVEGLASSPDRERAVRRIGAYATLDEAVLAARREIDESLALELAPCIPLARLSARYQSHGEAPSYFVMMTIRPSTPALLTWNIHPLYLCGAVG